MKISFEQITKDFVRDAKRYLEKSTFEPVLLRSIFNAIDNHDPDIKNAVRNYFALCGIEDGMNINIENKEDYTK